MPNVYSQALIDVMEILWISFLFLMLLIGIVGVFAPVLPGPLVAWIGILIYYIAVPAEDLLPLVNIWTLTISGVLVAGSFLFDYFSSYWGAVKFGATWRGGVGALVGGIVFPLAFSFVMAGIPGAIIGLLIGPIIGAFVGELLGGNTYRQSARAGAGTLLGALAATLVKLFVCMLMVVWILLSVCFFFLPLREASAELPLSAESEKTQLTPES